MLGTRGSARSMTHLVGLRSVRRAGLAGLLACLMLMFGAASAWAFEDFSGPAFQILAPGNGAGSASFSTDQGLLYDKLTPKRGKVTQALLEKDFLSEKFGVTGPVTATVTTPRGAALEINYDSHHIAHVVGKTRGDVMYGSGWLAGEDRALLLKLGLGPAYAAALGIPGINPFGLLLTGREFTPSKQAKEFVANQISSLEAKGKDGKQVISDLEEWVAGVNGWSTAHFNALGKTVTLPDAFAGFAFIGSIFGNGGGGELANAELLANLQSKLGTEAGTQVYRDLRESNDPEAPTTATEEFKYDEEPEGETPGSVIPEPGTESSAAVKAAAALKSSRRKASNFLLAGGALTASGHPVAVMGPQLGYFYPEIVFQADLHGPGVDAQGVIAPISPYVFIGRGRDFAWSLTSAGSENTQIFLEKLCNEDKSPPTRESTGYMREGSCEQMQTMDAGLLGPQGPEPAKELTFHETIHGPVTGTVLVNKEPYAIAVDRSTRGREPAGEVAFSKFDSDEVHNPTQFFEAANELETTFNMSYLDNEHIAYFSTGRLPVTAPGTNPSLPTLGTGPYDWKGFLTLEQHPHQVDPASHTFLNWNNKPAPGWGAASDNYSYGPVHRVQMYTGFGPGMTEASDASIMNRAATQDLRALKVWPVIAKVLATGPAPSNLAKEAAKVVEKWATKRGASRLGTEGPRQPGAAILDASWTGIGDAVLSPVLGEVLPEFGSIMGPDDSPSSGGSSYGGGWYGYVYKDLKSLLGESVTQPYSRKYCGNGDLTTCRESLWAAIQTAAEKLTTEQGSNMKAWRAAKVRITFPPGLLPSYTMRWTNRSTFQQVIEFTGHGP
jgi:acyl-homoserine lactone acylase PvdQ